METRVMNFLQAKTIFDQIVEIIYDLDNPRLISVITPLVEEVENADSTSNIILSSEELTVFLNEMDFNDDEEDAISDIHELIEKLLE